jgi:hypothetical protein
MEKPYSMPQDSLLGRVPNQRLRNGQMWVRA